MTAARRSLAGQLVEAIRIIRHASYEWSKIEQGDDRKWRVILNHAGDDVGHVIHALKGEQ